MGNTQIAAQLYTIRDFTKDTKGFEESMKKLQKIGYGAVQVSGTGPIYYKDLKAITDETGMDICATHIPYDILVNELSSVIAQHKHWNCKYIGLGSMPAELRNDTDEFIKIFNPIAKEIAKNGMKFVYHNHRFEFAKINGKNAFEVIAENTNPEEFGLLVDTYWVQAGGSNPAEFLRKYADRIDVVHLKDMQIIDDNQIMAEVGEGNMDWNSILEACNDINVEWYAIEQDVCQRDPFESLKISFDNVKKMGLK